MFSNKVYDLLKPVALVILPGVSTLYLALAALWHLPDAQQIVGTITAVNTFLGATLHFSTDKSPGDGQLIVDKSNPAKDVYQLNLTTPLEELSGKNKISLNVKPAQGTLPAIGAPNGAA